MEQKINTYEITVRQTNRRAFPSIRGFAKAEADYEEALHLAVLTGQMPFDENLTTMERQWCVKGDSETLEKKEMALTPARMKKWKDNEVAIEYTWVTEKKMTVQGNSAKQVWQETARQLPWIDKQARTVEENHQRRVSLEDACHSVTDSRVCAKDNPLSRQQSMDFPALMEYAGTRLKQALENDPRKGQGTELFETDAFNRLLRMEAGLWIDSREAEKTHPFSLVLLPNTYIHADSGTDKTLDEMEDELAEAFPHIMTIYRGKTWLEADVNPRDCKDCGEVLDWLEENYGAFLGSWRVQDLQKRAEQVRVRYGHDRDQEKDSDLWLAGLKVTRDMPLSRMQRSLLTLERHLDKQGNVFLIDPLEDIHTNMPPFSPQDEDGLLLVLNDTMHADGDIPYDFLQFEEKPLDLDQYDLRCVPLNKNSAVTMRLTHYGEISDLRYVRDEDAELWFRHQKKATGKDLEDLKRLFAFRLFANEQHKEGILRHYKM